MKLPAILFEKIKRCSSQKNIHALLAEIHRSAPDTIVRGRNPFAGYIRAEGIMRGDIVSFFKKDSVYQEALFLAPKTKSISEESLANLFFILKYGMNRLSGNIVVYGNCDAAAFLRHSVRCLGIPACVHVIHVGERILQAKETDSLNLQEGVTPLFPDITNIILGHIDCHAYAITKYALTAMQPLMHPAGGYLVVDHATSFSSSLEVFQAVEEMVQEQGLHAEQASPHFVYRVPKIFS